MFVLTFVCMSLKKGTNPCHEGGVVAEKLGVPQDQQECFCGRFVKDMPRTRGIPKFHTCVRQLGDWGRIFVTQDEPDTMRIDVRLKKSPDPDICYRAIRYLEERHPGTVWRMENEGGGAEPLPLQFKAAKSLRAAEPPPRAEEEPTTERLEPRPQGVKPQDLLGKIPYRGPLPEDEGPGGG